MTITVADIHRWDPGDVREVFNATRSRAEAAFEAADGLSTLPAFGSWGGDAADAARTAVEETRRDLDAHGNESLAVARAADLAADGIEKVKADLTAVEDEATAAGLQIDAAGRVLPGPAIEGSLLDMLAVADQMRDLQARLDAILAEADTVDDDLARAINMATGAEPLPDAPFDNRPEIIHALTEPLPEDADRFRDLWEQLTDEEKEWLYEQDRFLGNHPGMPFAERDAFNRRTLPELTREAEAEVEALRQEHPAWANGGRPNTPNPNPPEYRAWKERWEAANRTLDGYRAVGAELARGDATLADTDPTNDLPRLLAVVDDEGRAAVSINNPDEASRSATFIPGTGQDLANFEGSARKSEDMYWSALREDRSLARDDVSVTTWMGYDRPMDLGQAADPVYARGGADALSDFQDGLRASHDGTEPSINTVIGHSYGSTLMGAAGLDGNYLDADNVVAVGSPGILAGNAGDLNLPDGAHVFATRAENDIIGIATYATLGPDPMAARFGGIPFEAAPGETWPLGLPSIDAHSSYWDPGNPALSNMGRIIAGRTDVTAPTFTP